MTTLEQLLSTKIVAIIRGVQPHDVPAIANALFRGGVRCMEVTLNSPAALEVIETLALTMEGKVTVGAGTVLTVKEVSDAVAAGAKFIVSPVMNVDVIQKTKQLNTLSIPGAYTATEIYNAYEEGADIVKLFPATVDPVYIKNILAPLPNIPLMPTGGVDLDNIQSLLKAGAVAFGIGKSLVDSNRIVDEQYLKEIVLNAQKFIQAVNERSNIFS